MIFQHQWTSTNILTSLSPQNANEFLPFRTRHWLNMKSIVIQSRRITILVQLSSEDGPRRNHHRSKNHRINHQPEQASEFVWSELCWKEHFLTLLLSYISNDRFYIFFFISFFIFYSCFNWCHRGGDYSNIRFCFWHVSIFHCPLALHLFSFKTILLLTRCEHYFGFHYKKTYQ